MNVKMNLLFKKTVFSFIVLLLIIPMLSYCAQRNQNTSEIRPRCLSKGDTVALISSASRAPTDQDIDFARERLEKLGLKVILGKNVFKRDGYFAGSDRERAEDLNQAFASPKVKGIFEIRGGWGSDRILSLINYHTIKEHPKVFIGFSDITALLIAIHKQTSLITFHGPLGIEPWPKYTVGYLKQVLFDRKKSVYVNPNDGIDLTKDIIQSKNRIQTIHGGTAEGRLIGGNLSVLVTLIGSHYEPHWQGKILFIEDIGEKNYQIDRLLAQLQLAGVFEKIKGFIFGECTQCTVAQGSYGSKTLRQIIDHYVPKNIPAYMGAMIGHEPNNITIPEGVMVKMNANKGAITLLQFACER